MVRTSDFSRIPGYSETEREFVAKCLAAFIKDVDEDRGAA